MGAPPHRTRVVQGLHDERGHVQVGVRVGLAEALGPVVVGRVGQAAGVAAAQGGVPQRGHDRASHAVEPRPLGRAAVRERVPPEAGVGDLTVASKMKWTETEGDLSHCCSYTHQ